MSNELWVQINEIAEYHAKDPVEKEVIILKITRLIYGDKIDTINEKIENISSTCNDKLK